MLVAVVGRGEGWVCEEREGGEGGGKAEVDVA